MRLLKIGLLLCLTCVISQGCGKAYQSITADNLRLPLVGYEGRRISIVGVPETPQRRDFLPPTPLREGQWTLTVNGVRCTETINLENEPRLRSMLKIAKVARKENRPVKISGVIRGGQLEMAYFEEIRTDTSWYQNKNLYYSYGEYYEWYPFAYSPNSRVFKNSAAR